MRYLLFIFLVCTIGACSEKRCDPDPEFTEDIFGFLLYDNSGPSCEDILREQKESERLAKQVPIGTYRCISFEETISESRNTLVNYGIYSFDNFLRDEGHWPNDASYYQGRCYATTQPVLNQENPSNCEYFNGVDIITIHEDDLDAALAIEETAYFEIKWHDDIYPSDSSRECEESAEDVDILKRRHEPFHRSHSQWVYMETCNITDDTIDDSLNSAEELGLAVIDFACGEIVEESSLSSSCETSVSALLFELDSEEDAENIEGYSSEEFPFMRYTDSPEVKWGTCPST